MPREARGEAAHVRLEPRNPAALPAPQPRAASARIMFAAFSAIMMVGAFVFPEVITDITEASTTRNPPTPCTLCRGRRREPGLFRSG